MLDAFVGHLKKTKNRSLIARIYGVYTIKTNLFQQLDVIIMANSVDVVSKRSSRLTFDLKGSTIKRKTKLGRKDWEEVRER
mmetsp:Transcript_29302/g.44136  ORF Transcript_29302/g.44136 Transcript_29302/m.44136 type:complete len:81 (-) Transcript_29302:753-995(-)